jgi:DNA-binding NarL/FixJ family response regulator
MRNRVHDRNNVDLAPSYSSYRQEVAFVLHITPWERRLLELLALEATRADMARRLESTEDELERRLHALLTRMGAASPTDAVAAASRRGLLVAIRSA